MRAARAIERGRHALANFLSLSSNCGDGCAHEPPAHLQGESIGVAAHDPEEGEGQPWIIRYYGGGPNDGLTCTSNAPIKQHRIACASGRDGFRGVMVYDAIAIDANYRRCSLVYSGERWEPDVVS
jgi:hypothetical protein